MEPMRLLTRCLGRTLPSRRPEFLDGADQARAIRLSNTLKHASSSFLSELPVQSAREGLLLCCTAVQGGIRYGLSGTGAA